MTTHDTAASLSWPQAWIDAVPMLADLEPAHRALLANGVRAVRLPADARLFRPGEPCRDYLIVLTGSVTVALIGAHGQTITLYRVGRGQTCILTTACLLAARAYDAEGACETAVEALAITPRCFEAMLAASAVFRRFVFASYGTRLTDLLRLVDAVAFVPLEQRLVRWLLAQPGGAPIRATHARIAAELGSAREVITRHLGTLAERGLIQCSRGSIRLRDPAGLATIVAPPA